MKNKKRIVFLTIVLSLTALLLAALTSSCGLFGGGEDVVPVTVDSIQLLKTATDYTSSAEYEYNKDTGNTMALLSGEEFFLQINYNNPKKYAISYVTITPEGENAQKIMAKDFDAKSTKSKTVIRFSLPKTNLSNVEYGYTIKKIYYNTGSETKSIKFDKDNESASTEFSVVVNPTYTLKLNYQNVDYRLGSAKTEADEVTTENVSYGTEMNSVGVLAKDYSAPDSLPQKAGGWKFEGWYTKPFGDGICVTGTDKYYFWQNVTLYAHFSRLFDYEIVDLQSALGVEKITHEYISSVGTVMTKDFYYGAVYTGDQTAGKYPYLDVYDTIFDEKVENGHVDTSSANEYPVIKVANNAFKDVNNITTLSIGRYVREIGYCAFDNCNKLAKVTFSPYSTLKYIGDYAFQDTKNMGITSSFTIPETVEYIGNFCFRYSGWSNTNNNGINESVLHVYPRYNFIGVAAFFQTGFSKIIFEPGCHFESQIGYDEGKEIESASGWKTVRPEVNRIGMNLFANMKNLSEVEFLSDDPGENALNIIPDRCFDAGQYKNMKLISRLIFSEGLEYIGKEAFNYQEEIPYLDLPASLKEVGISAFYNNISVSSLTFRENSRLEILHRRCFGNLASIDRVEIISTEFYTYGDGPFEGCGRLKSIEFPNINDPNKVPMGFTVLENSDEVNTTSHHYYADLMFGTFETGTDDSSSSSESGTGEEENKDAEQQSSSYALPTRIFCKAGNENVILNKFRNNLITAKDTFYRSQNNYTTYKSGQYEDVVFVHDIDLIRTYENPYASPGEDVEVKVALQEVYDANSNAVLGYSLVFWSYRSQRIKIPSNFTGLKYKEGRVIELAMYCLPTSVTEVYVPSTVTRLEHDAFNGCTKLEKVTFEDKDTLQYIGDFAFFGTKISEFEGGASLKVIGQNAFMRCTSLKWVDLLDTAITNPFKEGKNNPRVVFIQQYKYEYELKQKDDDRKDYLDTLYDGAFRGCTALRWVAMPRGLKQMPEGLFTNCKNLRTVVILCTDVSTETSAASDSTFYYRATPTAIYDTDAVPYMTIYVPGAELKTHEMIFSSNGITYSLEDNIPAKP